MYDLIMTLFLLSAYLDLENYFANREGPDQSADLRQTACLVVNPIIVDGYASLFNCTTTVRASDSMTASS